MSAKLILDSPLKVELFLEMLGIFGPSVSGKADQLAGANGATAEVVPSYGFDLAKRRRIYTVITTQEDTVKGGDAAVNSKSRASAAAEVSEGLCKSATGYGVDIMGVGCKSAADWVLLCTPKPGYVPPFFPCEAKIDFTLKLKWKIYLVKNDL